MTALAFTLVLASSFIHATWNLLSKQVAGGAPFVWLVAAVSTVLYAPAVAAVLYYQNLTLGPQHYAAMAVSGLLHLVYFLVLQRGYRVGDLSLVYPLARGTGPTLSTLGAIALFGERPSPTSLAGAALVIAAIFLITTGHSAPSTSDADHRRRNAGIRYGLLTGAFIAAYTLWDARAVRASFVLPPLLLDYASSVTRAAVLAPVAWKRRDEVADHLRRHRAQTFWVAALSPLSFIMVLTALQMAPVSHVAPARELSILIGVLFGAKLLRESHAPRRLTAAALMLLGIAAIALG